MQNEKLIFDMGKKSSQAFHGISSSQAVREIYADSPKLFADTIRTSLPVTDRIYSVLDVGSSRGELVSQILLLLPEYHFQITAIDTNPDALTQNNLAQQKIVTDAVSLPFADKSFDIVLMRYLLQFNLLADQGKILSEISRVTKGIAVIQAACADNIDTVTWRNFVNTIFLDNELPQIKRSGTFWASTEELESSMKSNGIHFTQIQSKKIYGFSDVYTEKYSLTESQVVKMKKMLSDKDYTIQSTWIIHPR